MTIIRMMTIRMADRNRGNDGMTRFTDSPYEYMMAQKPDADGRRESSAPRYPPGHKCYGCPYGRDRPCVGICMKDLNVPKRGKKKGDHERSGTWERG